MVKHTQGKGKLRMNDGIRRIIHAVRPLKNKIHLNRGIVCIAIGLVVAGTVSTVLAFSLLLYPVLFPLSKIARIYLICTGLSSLAVFFIRPGIRKVLKVADTLGLKERLVTAYEFKNYNYGIYVTQRKDALKMAENFNYRDRYRIRIPRKLILAAVCLAVSTALSFAIPSEARQLASETETLVKQVNKQVEDLEKKKKKFNDKSEISSKNLKKINDKLEEMMKKLRKSEDEDEILKTLSQYKHELEKLGREDRMKRDLANLADELANNPITNELGNSVKNNNQEEFKQKLEKLINEMAKLNAEQRKKLEDTFEKASERVEGIRQLSQTLSDLSQAVNANSEHNTAKQIASLQSGLSSISDEHVEITDEMLQELLDEMKELKYSVYNMTGDNTFMQAGITGGQSSENGSGNTPGGNEGGNNSGNGNSEQGGSNAGNRSGNTDLGYTGEEKEGKGRGPGEMQKEDYEKIYVPERLGGDGDLTQVKGAAGGEGDSFRIDSDMAPVGKGGYAVPYNEVLGKYKNEAMTGLDGDTVPPVMKDIIRDYFTSLE